MTARETGRNDPCPCGSGRKYKKCCIDRQEPPPFNVRQVAFEDLPPQVLAALMRQQSEQENRVRRFGHVRRPISVDHQGHKFVAVGNKLYYAKDWRTFHDFLPNYIASVLTREWGNAEIKKPFDERHPILQWYHLLCDFQRQHIEKEGEIYVATMTGPVKAYMALAYDLYTLAHHSLLQERLIKRLKVKAQFQGARYETYVAAAFVRAGFDVTLEDETDSATSHCEFNATHRGTGTRYSVEAKSRHRAGMLGQTGEPKPSSEIDADVYVLLQRSLKKQAEHERIVCIDVNVPPVPDNAVQGLMKRVGEQLRRLEDSQRVDDPWPRAFVLFTNHPYHYVGNDTPEPARTTLFSAINNPDWKDPADGTDAAGHGAKLAARYPALRDLVDSVMNHTEIPHDFD